MQQLKELIILVLTGNPMHHVAQVIDMAGNTSIYQQACTGGCLSGTSVLVKKHLQGSSTSAVYDNPCWTPRTPVLSSQDF